MIITNNSQLMNCQTVEMFTCAHQSVCKGRSVDKTVLKPLLDLTKDVYGKGFSKNMAMMPPMIKPKGDSIFLNFLKPIINLRI